MVGQTKSTDKIANNHELQSQVEDSLITAFPNPANNQITFQWKENTFQQHQQLIIFDITGKIIEQFSVSSSADFIRWNTTLIPNGLYT